jgi:hypothetical protein
MRPFRQSVAGCQGRFSTLPRACGVSVVSLHALMNADMADDLSGCRNVRFAFLLEDNSGSLISSVSGRWCRADQRDQAVRKRSPEVQVLVTSGKLRVLHFVPFGEQGKWMLEELAA